MHSGLGIVPGRAPAGAAGAAPLQLSRLVGRERELADIERLLASQRLITLTGTGGTGKTRLAAEVALRTDARGDDSVAWVELAICPDAASVTQQVASALSVREASAEGTLGALLEALRERELLLVIDNCEHVIDSCAELVRKLLGACPRLRILATSREPLGVEGEHLCLVPPLALPRSGATDPGSLAAIDSVALFNDRAAAVLPSFRLDDENAVAIAEICRRLDGIPLAIELAAARIRHLSPQQIAARLDDSFSILSAGSRTALPHHRTLRAAIDWSYEILPERERLLLARLSVFAGSFSLDAVEAVCTDESIVRPAVLDLLGNLVDKSLLIAVRFDSTVRYQLLETIRQYAAERLEDPAPVRRRHALAFLQLARDCANELQEASIRALRRLDVEHDNVRAALGWSLEHDAEGLALPLAAAFRQYWYYRILWSEGFRWMSRVIESTADQLSFDRAAVIGAAGAFSAYLGDVDGARALLRRAESMWRALGEERHLAFTLSALAQLLGTTGELEEAQKRADESVALARKCGHPYDVAYCLTNAAAFIAQRREELEKADRYLEEAEAIWSEHPVACPFVLNARALLAIRRGDDRTAQAFALRALAVARAQGDLWFSSRSLRVIALTSSDDPARAARLLGAADAMLRAMSTGILLHERETRERLMSSLRASMPAEDLEAALLEGSVMTIEEACDLALSSSTPASTISAAASTLVVSDLGPLQIVFDGKRVSAEGRGSGRARELLAFIASHPQGRSKEEVGVAFWPDASPEQVKNSFHVTLHRLRKMLGQADAVVVEDGRYRFSPKLDCTVESLRFEREASAALRQVAGDASALEKLQSAIALYRGDYLQGEDVGEWCLAQRGHLRQLYFRALRAIGESLAERGRYTEAAEAFALLLSRDPYDEVACRQLMICNARLGARTDSLLIYRRLEERLRTDLSSTPEAETARLFRKLQQNEVI